MLFAVAHLTIAAIWLGSMVYSLSVVQPKVARFFTDERRREEFVTTLAHGNRWRVVGLIVALMVTGVAVIVVSPPAVAIGYVVALGLYAVAAAVFVYISWWHWPARVFASPDALPGLHRQFRILAWSMLALVSTAFLTALSVSVVVA